MSTKFSHHPLGHMEFDTGFETLAHLDADLNPEDGPEFTVKVEPYYWNLAEA